jgi:predicted TIM-barrel fold metal-dependent hydrolase
MKTRRETVLAGAAVLGLGLTSDPAGAVGGQARSADDAASPASGGGDDRHSGGTRMRIICLEEHVHDPVVASTVKDAFMAEVPYVMDIGSRYQEDPDREPQDRPRLTFLPKTMQIAAQPLANRIPAMDEAGIDFQVVSLSNEPQLAAKSIGADLVRGVNDRLAEAVAKHPGRFSAFFSLPWQDPDAAIREAERCVRDLKLPATMIIGRPADHMFLDDPRFDPVLAKLAELDAPLYIHPGPVLHEVQKPYYSGFNPDLTARLSLFGWGWHHEAGIHVIRLILSGALDRHRRLKIISGHWGEMVPFYLQRMDDTMPPAVTGLTRTIAETYRQQVWVSPSGMLNTPHFMFVREVLGIERIVFSIDYPYLTMTGARTWLESLAIPRREKEAIAFRNAESLMRLP